MTLRFSERYLTGLNLLLIGLLAYLLALSANDVIRGRLSGAESIRLPVASGVRPLQAQSYERAYYDVIARRDIFNLEPEREAPAKVATNLNVQLLGTSHLTLSRPFIVLLNKNNQQQSLYRLGDDIPGVGKLIGVYKDHAIVLQNGHRVKIEMPKQPGMPSSAIGLGASNGFMLRNLAPHRLSAAGVQKMGPDRYAVDRSALNDNLKNMASLFTQIRAVPNIGPNGQSDGFKLSQIQDGSLFQRIGLQDGDVLTSVEGQSVSNPMRAMQLLNTLRNRSSINLTVIRDGQPTQLHYVIR